MQLTCPNCEAQMETYAAPGSDVSCPRCGCHLSLSAEWEADSGETRTLLYAASPAEGELPDLPVAFGRYRVLSKLGVGGFGLVYKGFDDELQRTVAIKVPSPNRVATRRQVEAYLREARNLAQLDHPAIVQVFDFGRTEEGDCYLVSKFIEGADLAARLRDSQFSCHEAAEIVARIAEALHHAHEHRMVHRDVKPGNILLDKENAPYICDFGLALREEDYTEGKSFAGTPRYMSPEQARGEGHRVDSRSDIFSLSVVLYLLLCGRLPFTGQTRAELVQKITSEDPRPPRQLDASVPKAFDRICLKGLSKRAADRYSTAKDMADDLRAALAAERRETTGTFPPSGVPGAPEPSAALAVATRSQATSEARAAGVVPKGLRSFDEQDADVFLELLPGPRDRDGLPEPIRFWKTAIETLDPEQAFSVGLIYGPSGCGKSSFVKAGLVPQLADHVVPILLDTTAKDTETRLLRRLKAAFPELARCPRLAEAMALLRRSESAAQGGKVLVVLDQFEQWLHAKRDPEGSELVRALRHCDGRNLQCLLLIRDDFWMAVTRFMRHLEVGLVEGHNSAAVDLFDPKHARRVLVAFGRAYGRLPLPPEVPDAEQNRFLDQTVAGLAHEDRIFPVQLALFAEMVKGRPWTSATWKKIGGTSGLGVTFLEETFAVATAPPAHRLHQQAARAVLKSMLPEQGSEIRGRLRSRDELLAASGYTSRSAEFDDLMQILDGELRILTPVDPEGMEDTGSVDREETSEGEFYLLTHDYLVPAIRQWLTRKQRETMRGRAELRLSERAGAWVARREPRQLPSAMEWLSASLLTRRRNWTEQERQMMWLATQRWAAWGLLVAVAAVAVVYAGLTIRRRATAEHLVSQVLQADYSHLPAVVEQVRTNRRLLAPRLLHLLDDPDTGDEERLRVSLAMLDEQSDTAAFIRQQALRSEPRNLPFICDLLQPRRQQFVEPLWQAARSSDAPGRQRLRAGGMLAQLDPTNPTWEEIAGPLASLLVKQHQLELPDWIALFLPVRDRLGAALMVAVREPDRSETERVAAAVLLSAFAADRPDKLCELALDASPAEFAAISPWIEQNRSAAVSFFRDFLSKEPQADVPPGREPPTLAAEDKRLWDASGGLLEGEFALCHALPYERFESFAATLEKHDYRPAVFRPYRRNDRLLVAAVWDRDGLAWRTVVGKSGEEIEAMDASLREEGFLAFDLAHVASAGESGGEFAALWVKPDGQSDVSDAAVYVDVADSEHSSRWEPLNEQGFVPRTNLITGDASDVRRSSVRWKIRQSVSYKDCWQNPPEEYASQESEAWCHVDIRCNPERTFGGVWWTGYPWLSHTAGEMSLADHLEQCRLMADKGYRPESISVVVPDGGGEPIAGSVWLEKAVSEDAKDRIAARRANALVGLARLGEPGLLNESLEDTHDPRVATYVVHRLRPLGIEMPDVLRWLDAATDTEARRSLILALATYEGKGPPAETEARASELFQEDRDPGIHASAELVLRRWGKEPEVDSSREVEPDGSRRAWFPDHHGNVLVVIPGPVEFEQGSLGTEPGRDNSREWRNHRRIPRSYAIASREVTVDQFLDYDEKFAYATEYSPDGRSPINSVDWYDAARYCRWLSEQENIPKDEMCFPPIDQIGPDMELPQDLLDRRGYRLPTESEWEFACRAYTTTPRYYGYAPELLRYYARTAADGRFCASPVGTTMPNQLGLFDMLGNAMEWCCDDLRSYPKREDGGPLDDLPDVGRDGTRATRGGGFLYQPYDARSAHRDAHRVERRRPYLGFRVARTIKPLH